MLSPGRQNEIHPSPEEVSTRVNRISPLQLRPIMAANPAVYFSSQAPFLFLHLKILKISKLYSKTEILQKWMPTVLLIEIQL
jgi:hypothetical protein